MSELKKVCVFCGSSFGNNDIYLQAAKELSDALIKNNLDLVYGGAKVGLMGELANHMIASGGKVTGIIPDFLSKREVAHTELDDLIIVKSMHERKQMMQEKADAFIALPGGFGTFEEIFEMITWGQLNLHRKPCAFLNINNFYDHLNSFLVNAVEEGFIEKVTREMVIVENSAEILIQKLRDYKHPEINKAKLALAKLQRH